MKKIFYFSFVVFTILLAGCSTNVSPAQQNILTNKTADNTEILDVLQVDDEGNTKINTEILSGILNEAAASELTEDEQAGIKFMLEEEKLARDVYIKLFEKWNQQNFQNISQSEATHINAVKNLAEKYGIDIEFYNDEVGKYKNEELAKLFNDLVAEGNTSLINALEVGALIEEIDIIDLDKYLNQTSNSDIELVYENLKSGSRNHLRSFVRTMNSQGQNYEPQKLGQTDYDEIINSETEKGGFRQGEQENQKSGRGGQK
ncbi:hypothetical protein C0583_03440 [Candidatus Parcubacteria bacterium]|nr:MAG: hypothetical protein C0583_03440 [Candidatus Parcubacteria bacterium]